MNRALGWLSSVCVFILSGLLRAEEVPGVQAALAAEIIGPRLTMEEAQAFTEKRVPGMPSPASVAEWEPIAEAMRRDVLEKIVFRGEAAQWRDAQTKVEWLETIEGGPGYKIKKVRYEALPGLWIPALLYEPENLNAKVPVILNVNGHEPTGKAVDYKQLRCINLAKRGILNLNVEWFGMGQLRTDGYHHARMNQIDLCGTSGLAPFYLAMSRGLDLLLSLEHADPNRVGVMGLSGGGWQTIIISSLDKRVTFANPVAGYSSFRTRARNLSDLGDSEQTPNDLATIADYTHLTALLAPRPTLLTYNAKDQCCFAADHALQPLLDAAAPIFKLYGQEGHLRSHVNIDPGTHNFEVDNRHAMYCALEAYFFAGLGNFETNEIPSEPEVKAAEQLNVPLPEPNEDFHTLAAALAASLPNQPPLPSEKAAALTWQEENRKKLREVVHAPDYSISAEAIGHHDQGEIKGISWKLRAGDEWTVPAVELMKGTPKGSVILLADGGRASASAVAEAGRLIGAGYRVIAVDPFYFGESRVAERDYLFALLIGGVGERPLGIQSGEVAAIARWLRDEKKIPVTVEAIGPRTSLIALVAAALEPDAISALELHETMGSLKEIIESNGQADRTPELFCFGLLEHFDITHLVALAAPRPINLPEPSPRVEKELSNMKAWYGLFDAGFGTTK